VTDYYSLPTARLENAYLTIDYLTHAGPRIVRLIPRRLGQNLLAETPRQQLDSPYGPFHLWGGHRLWHAPETAARTYIPDDGGLTVAPLPPAAEGDGVCLRYMEPHSGIHKEIRLRLAADAPRVTLTHRLTNLGLWPVELAPWAITQLKTGGTAVLPTPPGDPDDLLPNRVVALWPYSRWDDPRLRLTEAARALLAHRGGHLGGGDPAFRRASSHSGRLSGAPGHRSGLRRSHRPCPSGDARQDLVDSPRWPGGLPGAIQSV